MTLMGRDADLVVVFETHATSLDNESNSVSFMLQLHSNGECYEQVVARVSAWLTEATTTFPGRTVLVVGHRATFYALEHLIRHIPLREAVTSTGIGSRGGPIGVCVPIMPRFDSSTRSARSRPGRALSFASGRVGAHS